MVLLDDVVEVLHLLKNDRNFAAGLDLIYGRFVGATFVHRDFFRNIAGLHGFVKEAHGSGLVALGGQLKVDRLAFLVYKAAGILPDAFDLAVYLVHSPVPANRAFVLARHLFKQRQKPDHPAVDRKMVNKYATLLHYFLKMAIAQWIRGVPTDANQNHIDWESHPFGRQHLVSSLLNQSAQHRPAG